MYTIGSILGIIDDDDLRDNFIQSLREASEALEVYYRDPTPENYKAWRRADGFMSGILSEIERRRYLFEGEDDGQLSK